MGRGNSPFWYEYGQSQRRNVVIGKYLPVRREVNLRVLVPHQRVYVRVGE